MPANPVREKRDLLFIFGLPNPSELLVRVAISGEVQVIAQGPQPLDRVLVLLQTPDGSNFQPRVYNLLEFAPIAWWRNSTTLLQAVESGWLYVDISTNVVVAQPSQPEPDCCDLSIPRPPSPLIGDILVWNGTEWTTLNPGLIGNVLTSNGPLLVPSYQPGGGGAGMIIGGSVTGGTTGSLLFVGPGPALAQDNINLFWDNPNNRLGLGTTSPSATLSVGASSEFQVGSTGNIVKLNNVTTNFPSVQGAASTILTNDGVGNLSWVAASAGMAIGGSVSGATAGSVLFAGAAGVLQQDNANFFWDDTNNRLGIGTNVPGHTLTVTAGSLVTGKRAISVTAALAASSVDEYGMRLDVTSAGSAVGSQPVAFAAILAAGATGSTNPIGARIVQQAGGNVVTTWSLGIPGNVGTWSSSYMAASTGHSVGVYGDGTGSSTVNAGVFGSANSVNALNVGSVGHALNATTNVGGFFSIGGAATPSFTSAALICDNTNQTDPIFIARDNGTAVFSVIDGGALEVAEIAAPATPASGFGRIYAKSDNLLYFKNDAGTEFDLTAAGSMAIGGSVSGATAGSVLFAGVAGVLAQDNANFFWDDTNNRLGIGTSTPDARVHVVAGTQPTGTYALHVTGTIAASVVEEHVEEHVFTMSLGDRRVFGANYDLSGVGSGGTTRSVATVRVTNNATGSLANQSWAVNGSNAALSVGVGSAGTAHNVGMYSDVQGSTTQNAGVFSVAVTNGVGTNIGAVGLGANSTGFRIGLLGRITSLPTLATPTLASAALFATNGDTTDPIFLARDDNTTVFSIADGGAVVSTSTSFTIGGAGTMTWPGANASGVLTNNGSGVLSWQTPSVLTLATTTVTTATTLDATNYTVRGDATGAAFTVTLPAAAGVTGRVYVIKKIDSSVNVVTVDANGAETIDGATTYLLNTQYDIVTIQSNGTSWDIL